MQNAKKSRAEKKYTSLANLVTHKAPFSVVVCYIFWDLKKYIFYVVVACFVLEYVFFRTYGQQVWN